MSIRRWPSGGSEGAEAVLWRLFQVLTLAGFGYVAWQLLGHTPYRIDIDVYRMGGRAWLDGQPLYADGATFHTLGGIDLPFTYPPLSAVVFAPFAWLPLPAASAVMTLITLVLLVVSTVIVLNRLDFWADGPDRTWVRRTFVAMAAVALAVSHLEPLRANFEFGQINVVLMTLVIADLVPRRTPWPRGLLLGLAIALKLTPAVFLVYLALRRDGRAAVVAIATFVAATVLGCVLAWRDSWEYWTTTLRDTDRIGNSTLNTNQNIAALLAREEYSETVHFALWTAACLAALALAVWAGRRVLRADEPVLALTCIALFGLVVSPVSWSHHWVWTLPTLIVLAVAAWRRRSVALAAATLAGIALLVWTPIELLPEHREADASWWRQLLGGSYVWWALAVIVTVGVVVTQKVSRPRSPEAASPAPESQALHPL
ncbi:alpha-(1-2)-phosphatidylinositol mannosyltransferase [Mycobacterium sp. MS1601]|uniref:glycosyltransferase family 87 protein n=1 Tax=Mycobacterium sp. MS1601 TaxID=1936029 RepID=UPI00097907DE|nr:glycosyltransferase family 87 protein [Mycobacterium sp. MS1601]AQA04839.1 alpha-(1-2)-phosphatidylinositol mannosyltransferase [Mycobacterium sp. MS1601]